MMEDSRVLVGKIVGAQGLRGEVRVQTYTESPDDFRNLDVTAGSRDIATKQSQRLKFIRRSAPGSTVVIAKIDGIDNRIAAETLCGTDLFIDRIALPVPEPGRYYVADLIGMKVIKGIPPIDGGASTVIAVHNFGAGDILELSDGEMVSFAGAEVEMDKKEITLKG